MKDFKFVFFVKNRTEHVDPAYIPPTIPGWVWLCNSSKNDGDDAMNEVRSCEDNIFEGRNLMASPFSPQVRYNQGIKWAIYACLLPDD